MGRPGRGNPDGRQEEEGELPAALKRVVELARCHHGEDRYRRLMDLARRVKGLPELPDRRTLARVLDAWNAASGERATGRWRARLWADFCRYLRGVKHPIGHRLRDAVRRALARPAQPWASRYAGNPELTLLASLCRELDVLHRGGVFPLSIRTAQAAADTSYRGARAMLELLQTDGVIELVEKGLIGPRSRTGTTWRYVGDSAAG